MRGTSSFLHVTLLVSAAFSNPAWAVPYVAKLLAPVGGISEGAAIGIFDGTVVGYGHGAATANNTHALIWNGSNANPIDINFASFTSTSAIGIAGNTQVGYGSGPTTSGLNHAIVWHGSAASSVDLNPVGFNESYGWSTTETNQVGYGLLVGNTTDPHALLWSGSAASAIDLTPAGFSRSWAFGTYGSMQVGEGLSATATGGVPHALLWNGSPNSFIDLNPNWGPDTRSDGHAIYANNQVGSSYSTAFGSFSHATLWNGTAASAVDLNPVGFDGSEASGIYGNYQVGDGRLPNSTTVHALLWNGTAASVVDLHQYLAGLPITITSSFASGISSDGTIVGLGTDSDFKFYPIVWTPVPEPASALSLLVGALGLSWQRKSRRL